MLPTPPVHLILSISIFSGMPLTPGASKVRSSDAEEARCWCLRCRGRKSQLFFRLAAFRECKTRTRRRFLHRYLFWHRKSRTARVGFAWGEIQAFPATRHDCNVSYRVGKVTSGGNPQPWPQVKNRTRKYFIWFVTFGTSPGAGAPSGWRSKIFRHLRGTDNSLAIATSVANHFAGP